MHRNKTVLNFDLVLFLYLVQELISLFKYFQMNKHNQMNLLIFQASIYTFRIILLITFTKLIYFGYLDLSTCYIRFIVDQWTI